MSSENKIFEDFARSRVDSFYENVYPGLLLYAIRWLGNEHSFLAEDCVQNAVLNAWKRRNDFASTAAIKSYLYTCIKNNIIDIQRKHSAKEKYTASLDDDIAFSNSIIDQETINMLCKTIDSLPEKYKVVLEMSFIDGLKNLEIARELGVSDSSVEKRKAKALELVREKLIDIYGDTIFVTMLMIDLWSRLR
jgi:RNA polymerase sigma-70 factor (ECF subfamily)